MFVRAFGRKWEKAAADYANPQATKFEGENSGRKARNPMGTLVASGPALQYVAFNRDLIRRLRASRVYCKGTLALRTYTKGEGDRDRMDTLLETFAKEQTDCITAGVDKSSLQEFRKLYAKDRVLGDEEFRFPTEAFRPESESDTCLVTDVEAWELDKRADLQNWTNRVHTDHPKQANSLQIASDSIGGAVELVNGAFFGPHLNNDKIWNGHVQRFGTEYPPGVATGLCDAFTRAIHESEQAEAQSKPPQDGTDKNQPEGARSVLMFALGYSGTGKTYTIQGKLDAGANGMVSRAAKLQMASA